MMIQFDSIIISLEVWVVMVNGECWMAFALQEMTGCWSWLVPSLGIRFLNQQSHGRCISINPSLHLKIANTLVYYWLCSYQPIWTSLNHHYLLAVFAPLSCPLGEATSTLTAPEKSCTWQAAWCVNQYHPWSGSHWKSTTASPIFFWSPTGQQQVTLH